ncbi:MAG: beta strand repeat-containing protein [Prosthecobacter sp.]|uniref:beta strand repeat-containing protein n=1 Tax=Prosthecobacter sp. TaxID=1965333 RepID=UPI0039034C3C
MAPGRPFLWRVHAPSWVCTWICALGVQISCPANPIGGVVTLGDAQIQNSVPGLTTIVQSTDRAVIDWQSFSIGAGERTNFIVPDATSATLNRVLGCDPSILNGTLTSNGHLFLLNSNGIIFGQGSTVDVGSLTASTLDLDNGAFMAGGEMVFKGSSEAAVKNAGMINASTGDVFLIGYQVSNSGTIRAPNGTVGLAAGSEVLIMPVGDERVVVRNAAGSRKKTGVSNSGVIEANVAEIKAYGGNVYALAIRNTGRIAATGVTRQGGRILLSANGGKIENSGSLVARGTSGNGGQIKVSAGSKGKVTINGRVDADGPDGSGGQVSITGEQVTIRRAIWVSADGATEGGRVSIGSDAEAGTDEAAASKTVIEGVISANSSQGMGGEIRLGGNSLTLEGESVISASGALGGGRIFAGGGFDGSLVNSTCVLVECGALLTANALENGNGGKVMVLASKELTFQGSLQALGGVNSGAGGYAELSAKESLSIAQLGGYLDLSASNGRAGSLLIASGGMLILNPGNCPPQTNFLDAEDVSNFLNTANLTVQTDRSGDGSGNIVVSGTVAWCSANSLTINADCDFSMINTDGGVGIIDSQGGGNVTISATGSVLLEAETCIVTSTGNVSLTGVGVTSIGGTVNAGSGTILLDGNDGAIHLAGALTTTNGTGTAVRIIDATTVTLGDITTGAAGTVVLGESGGDTLSGAVTQTGAINAGTVIGNTGSTVTLDGNNTVGGLGAFTSTGAFTFNDTTGGLNMTGSVETRGGAAAISTMGGVLALGSNSITTSGGNVSLTGTGVTSTGGTVNAGAGTILVDGNDGAVNLAGALTTTNGTSTAVRIIDATTASLGNITTGAAGTVVLGEAGGDNLSGAVTQTGSIDTGTLTGNGGSTVMLDGSNKVVNLGPLTSVDEFVFKDTTGGLNVTGNVETHGGAATVSTAGGALALGNSSITTQGGNVSLTGVGVTSSGGAVDAGGGTILVDGNDGAINLAGELKTTNGTASAVRVIDATTASLGNITTGAAGTVVLGEAGADNLSGAVTQTGAIDAGTLTGNGGSTVTLDGSNKVVNLGPLTSVDAFVFNDTTGGLNVTGNVETRGGAATVATAGGALALGGHSVTTSGGNVSLTGEGVSSTGGAVNAGSGTILVDGNDGAINLAGALTTTNGTSTAVRVIDATTASLGNITTGAAGTVALGGTAGDNLSGAVTQTGAIKAGGLILAGNGDFTLTGAANAIGVVATAGPVGSLALANSIGLTIGGVGAASGLSAMGDIRVAVTGTEGLLIQHDITSQGGVISMNAAGIAVNSATISSVGTAAVTLTANQFVLLNQPIIQGVLNGAGSTAQLSLSDSNLTTGQNYIVGADKITAGSRIYSFQNMSALRLDLGSGNDNADTNFFSFTQHFNAGGGSNKFVVDGKVETNSPLTRPGFGTITFTELLVPNTAPFGAVLLQNATPGSGPGSGSSSQTNNFNSTGTSGATSGASLAGLGAGGASAALSGGLTASLSGSIGQSLGLVSAGGGAPPSFGLQSQMNATTSAATESELSLALGGDGTMGVRSSTGLVAVDPSSGPPTPKAMAQLDEGFSLLALSELSFGAIGLNQVTVTSQLGVQSMVLGGPPPNTALLQLMAKTASPESFSQLFAMLGGDGTARIDNLAGSVAVDLLGKGVPGYIQSILAAVITPGAFGELSHALGGTGEFIVNDAYGLAIMDPSGAPAGQQVSAAALAMLAAGANSELSLVLGDEGAGLVMAWDGIQSTAFDTALPSPLVIAQLNAATNPQSQEELDTATR